MYNIPHSLIDTKLSKFAHCKLPKRTDTKLTHPYRTRILCGYPDNVSTSSIYISSSSIHVSGKSKMPSSPEWRDAGFLISPKNYVNFMIISMLHAVCRAALLQSIQSAGTQLRCSCLMRCTVLCPVCVCAIAIQVILVVFTIKYKYKYGNATCKP